jgi:NAD(P)-dependent dehydrogenase (short-subunit alcohol dehydrogenase family)
MVPPINLENKTFLTAHLGYTLSKFGAAMMTKGLGYEYEGDIAFNTLWP